MCTFFLLTLVGSVSSFHFWLSPVSCCCVNIACAVRMCALAQQKKKTKYNISIYNEKGASFWWWSDSDSAVWVHPMRMKMIRKTSSWWRLHQTCITEAKKKLLLFFFFPINELFSCRCQPLLDSRLSQYSFNYLIIEALRWKHTPIVLFCIIWGYTLRIYLYIYKCIYIMHNTNTNEWVSEM